MDDSLYRQFWSGMKASILTRHDCTVQMRHLLLGAVVQTLFLVFKSEAYVHTDKYILSKIDKEKVSWNNNNGFSGWPVIHLRTAKISGKQNKMRFFSCQVFTFNDIKVSQNKTATFFFFFL